ncbi:MAG: hypothetical protein WAM14_25470, partial [Candidatus Nitrosopolaris sp.]
MTRTFPQIKSIVNQKAFFVLLVLLLSVTLIFESQLHVIYAGNNSIFSRNQINLNATHNNIGINNSTLQITTDKQRYVPGETVIVTIKNNWKVPLEFPDSLLGLNIENVKTGQKAGLLAAQVISELKPNESKTFQWDQKDTNANQAEPGIYKAESSPMTKNLHNTQPITANTT